MEDDFLVTGGVFLALCFLEVVVGVGTGCGHGAVEHEAGGGWWRTSWSVVGAHTCAVGSEGQLVVCFGTDLDPAVTVSAGFSHTCAVRSEGQLVCFGTDLDPVVAVLQDLLTLICSRLVSSIEQQDANRVPTLKCC